MDNLFDVTFTALRESLSNMTLNTLSLSGMRIDGSHTSDFKNIMESESRKSVSNRIQDIQRIKRLLRRKFLPSIQRDHLLSSSIRDLNAEVLHLGSLRQVLLERRLVQQQLNVERRLRELIFEITGEYGKSILRLNRRADFIKLSGRIQITQHIWKLRWERFAKRLSYETAMENINNERKLNQISTLESTVLCPRSDAIEFKIVHDILRNQLGQQISNHKIISILRFTKTRDNLNNISSQNTSNALNISPCLLTTASELFYFKQILIKWLQSSSAVSSRNGPRPSIIKTEIKSPTLKPGTSNIPRINEFLDTSAIQWLHPPSFGPTYWDSIQKLQSNIVKNNSKKSISSTTSTTSTTPDGFDDFTERYASQFSSSLTNPRVFFCIEERAAACAELPLPWRPDQHIESPTAAMLSHLQVCSITSSYHHKQQSERQNVTYFSF